MKYQKMKSRKFWLAVLGCTVCLIMMCMTFPANQTLAVVCLAMGAMIVVAYMIAQGWVDRANAISHLTVTQNRGEAYEKKG